MSHLDMENLEFPFDDFTPAEKWPDNFPEDLDVYPILFNLYDRAAFLYRTCMCTYQKLMDDLSKLSDDGEDEPDEGIELGHHTSDEYRVIIRGLQQDCDSHWRVVATDLGDLVNYDNKYSDSGLITPEQSKIILRHQILIEEIMEGVLLEAHRLWRDFERVFDEQF